MPVSLNPNLDSCNDKKIFDGIRSLNVPIRNRIVWLTALRIQYLYFKINVSCPRSLLGVTFM